MNADEIKQLGRTPIQKIAKIEGIRANATSQFIITELLKKYPGGVPRDHEGVKEVSKGTIKAGTVQVALLMARTGGSSAIATPAEGEAPTGQPIIKQRVTRSKAKKNLRDEQTAGTIATNNAATAMSSVINTDHTTIPTVQAGEAGPEVALSSPSVQAQPEARDPALASASAFAEANVQDGVNVGLRIEKEGISGSNAVGAGPALRSPSPAAEGADGIDAALADIAAKREAKGKGKGKAGPASPSPQASTIPLPEEKGDHDSEAEKEAELQRLFEEAKERDNRLENRIRWDKKLAAALRSRPAQPVLTVDTSPAVALQQQTEEPAPATRRRQISPGTLYNDPRYPWPRLVGDTNLAREPMAAEGSEHNINGLDERWVVAAYMSDIAATGYLPMIRTATMTLRGQPLPPPEPRQIIITGGPAPQDTGSPVDTEVDSDEEKRKDPEEVVDAVGNANADAQVPGWLPPSSPLPSSQRASSPGDDADEEPELPIASSDDLVAELRGPTRNGSRGPLPSLFASAGKYFAGDSSRAARSPLNGSDEQERHLSTGRDKGDEAANAFPRKRSADNSRRLRREGVVTCSPKRRTPSSPISSGGSTEPAASPPRNDNSSQNVLQPVRLASRSQNLAALFEQPDGEDILKENEKNKENKENEEEEVEWPSRGWNSSELSMPSGESSSPARATRRPTVERVKEIERECTAMTNEMGPLRRRIEDLDRLLRFTKASTEQSKALLAEYRKWRKVIQKFCLPMIAKDERLSNGRRKWRRQKESDEPVDWYFKMDRSPSVSDDDLVATEPDEPESEEGVQEQGSDEASSGPVAGPSNSSAASGVGSLSFKSVEDWEEFVQVARDDGTWGPKRVAQRGLDDGRRKRARHD